MLIRQWIRLEWARFNMQARAKKQTTKNSGGGDLIYFTIIFSFDLRRTQLLISTYMYTRAKYTELNPKI